METNNKKNIMKYGVITLAIIVILLIAIFIYNVLNTKYTVTFYNEDNTVIETKQVKTGKFVLEPAEPQKEGYRFIGWYYDEQLFNFKTKIKKNINLYAKYEPIEGYVYSYIVSFDSNYGTQVPYQVVEHGKTAKVPTPPIKNGYTLVEWRHNGSKYDFNTPVTSDITLVAYWEVAKSEDEKNMIKAKDELTNFYITTNYPNLTKTVVNGKCSVTWENADFSSIIRDTSDTNKTVVANITCGSVKSTKSLIVTIKKSTYTYNILEDKYIYIYDDNTLLSAYKLYDKNNKQLGNPKKCPLGQCVQFSVGKLRDGEVYYIVFNNNTGIKYAITSK